MLLKARTQPFVDPFKGSFGVGASSNIRIRGLASTHHDIRTYVGSVSLVKSGGYEFWMDLTQEPYTYHWTNFGPESVDELNPV